VLFGCLQHGLDLFARRH